MSRVCELLSPPIIPPKIETPTRHPGREAGPQSPWVSPETARLPKHRTTRVERLRVPGRSPLRSCPDASRPPVLCCHHSCHCLRRLSHRDGAGPRSGCAPAAVKSPLIAFATTTTEDGLSISTDKDDYQPGDVVHLTGSGWQGGDVLDVILVDNPQTHDPIVWSVDVAADGMFHDSTYVVDAGDLDVAFTLTATSRGTGRSLTVQFTDANISNNVTVTPGTISVVRGSDAVYTVTVNFGGNGAACNAPLTVTGLPLGATGTFNPTSVSAAQRTRVSVLRSQPPQLAPLLPRREQVRSL